MIKKSFSLKMDTYLMKMKQFPLVGLQGVAQSSCCSRNSEVKERTAQSLNFQDGLTASSANLVIKLVIQELIEMKQKEFRRNTVSILSNSTTNHISLHALLKLNECRKWNDHTFQNSARHVRMAAVYTCKNKK